VALAYRLVPRLESLPGTSGWKKRNYGVIFDNHKNPRAEEVEKAVQIVVMVRIRLC